MRRIKENNNSKKDVYNKRTSFFVCVVAEIEEIVCAEVIVV